MNIWSKNRAPEDQLEFCFMSEMREADRKPKADLKRFPEPKNDNDRLFNLQAEFYDRDCDDTIFWQMWTLAEKVCERIIKKKTRSSRHKYDRDELDEKKSIAVEYVMRRFKYETGYCVTSNWIVALEQGVKHALEYQTEAQKIVDYVPIESLSNIAIEGDYE